MFNNSWSIPQGLQKLQIVLAYQGWQTCATALADNHSALSHWEKTLLRILLNTELWGWSSTNWSEFIQEMKTKFSSWNSASYLQENFQLR